MSSTKKRMKNSRRGKDEEKDEDTVPLMTHEESDEDEEKYVYKWDKTKKTPWKAILLAIFLFLVGTVLIIIGILIITRIVILDDKERGIPFLVLGSICFIPGAYYVYVIIQIAKKNPEYSFMDFPEM